ncbi:MAG: hypothetical protein CFE26_06065 [Verrucomicrobiales bacterium VVV1]|nr:MAG: hypothetical protein CFE26_06065 [Verrucomicrobiales bacterium VVV1]
METATGLAADSYSLKRTRWPPARFWLYAVSTRLVAVFQLMSAMFQMPEAAPVHLMNSTPVMVASTETPGLLTRRPETPGG